MTDLHHPSDETLARFAAGSLGGGPMVVVAAHNSHCPRCRAVVATFEAVGGALLDDLPPSDIAPDGLARALAAIERGAPVVEARRPPGPGARPELPAGFVLPAALNGIDFGKWRWVAPGIHVSRARGGGDLKLLRVEPGKRLFHHGHSGAEWTLIMAGSYADGRARFVAGDMSEVDQNVDHQPVIDSQEACICLVAEEGSMRPRTLFGRAYQMIFYS